MRHPVNYGRGNFLGMWYRQDKDPTRFSRGMIECACNGKWWMGHLTPCEGIGFRVDLSEVKSGGSSVARVARVARVACVRSESVWRVVRCCALTPLLFDDTVLYHTDFN